jgi:hypothetical protein
MVYKGALMLIVIIFSGIGLLQQRDMDTMRVVEPQHSAQVPQYEDEPEEEEEVCLLQRQLFGIIHDAERHIAFGRVRLQPPETRTHLLERVHHLQAHFDINNRMPLMLHACAVILHRGLSAPFRQSTLLSLLHVARDLCRSYYSGYQGPANHNNVFFCLRDALQCAWCGPDGSLDFELRLMLCVLPDILRDILHEVNPLLQNRYMPVVYKIEAA